MPDCIEYTIHVSEQGVKELLIAYLVEAGATGFEEQKTVLKAFAPLDPSTQTLFEQIIEDLNVSFSKSVVHEQNWNASWEADFKPVTVGNFCCVRALFHEPNPDVKFDIIITPKMSFGTGHHATTFLMIQAMEAIDFSDTIVFDFGTGTGILAILAEKCGAKQVIAVDNDDWSINNATENFNINHCQKTLIKKSDGLFEEQFFDVILANINRNVILESLQQIKQHLVKNGVVLLSGLLQGDEEVIVSEAARWGLVLHGKTEMNGWISLLMVNA